MEQTKITFNLPPRRESVRLNLSVSEETYKQLKIIQFTLGSTMAQVVEMLMTAALPEYFVQFPVEEGMEDKLFLEAEGEKSKRCYYPKCMNPYSYHQQKNMVFSDGNYFCSNRCRDFFNGTTSVTKTPPPVVRQRTEKVIERYCQNAKCLDKGPFPDDNMIKMGELWFCDQECADEYNHIWKGSTY